MPNPNQPRRPNQSPLNFGGRLLGRLGDRIQDGISDARGWVDERAADAKGAATDLVTRFPPVADAMSRLPPPFGVNDGDSNVVQAKVATPADEEDIAELARKYESGGRGPGTIGRIKGDPGGPSYGSYQMATNLGTPQRFLDTYGKQWKPRFGKHLPGSPEFDQTWQAIASEDSETFAKKQTQFMANDYFKVQSDLIRRETGFDISNRSRALKNAVFSTATQHGERTSLIAGVILGLQKAHPGQKLTDSQIIDGIYAERGRIDAKGRLVHFVSQDRSKWPNLQRRFRSERQDAQRILSTEH